MSNPNPLADFLSPRFSVLGHDAEGAVYVLVRDLKSIQRFAKVREIDTLTLLQWLGAEEWIRLSKATPPKGETDSLIRKAIAFESRNTTFDPESFIGQGVWSIKGVTYVVINRGVYRLDESLIELPLPVVENRLIDYRRAKAWIDVPSLQAALDGVTPESNLSLLEDLKNAFGCWEFSLDLDRELVIGLVCATVLQTVWPFRPHVWISGWSDSGKTALKTLIYGMFPYARSVAYRLTEAGLRQAVGRDALPVFADEQEPQSMSDRVLELLRASTRGDTVIRGSPTGDVVEYRLQHMVWLFSIAMSLSSEADRNRFAYFELLRPEKITLPESSALASLGVRILAAMLRGKIQISEIYAAIARHSDVVEFGRLAEVYALPVAVMAYLQGVGAEQAVVGLVEVLVAKVGHADPVVPEEDELLQTIALLRPDNELTVAEMLVGNFTMSDGATNEATLGRVGVRVLENGDVFIAHKILQPAMKFTRWANADLGRLLRRIEGVRADKQRVFKQPTPMNGVRLPSAMLAVADAPEI